MFATATKAINWERERIINSTSSQDKYLQFYGSLTGSGSLENASRQVAYYLLEHFSNVQIHDYSSPVNTNPKLQSHLGICSAAPVGVFVGSPDSVPDFFVAHKHKIAFFDCVSTELPDEWVSLCNKLDHLVVPSKFCQEVLIEAGTNTPISVLAHGIDPVFDLSESVSPSCKEFWFLEIFTGESHHRKSFKELIRAFKRTFANEPHVKLKLHVQDLENVNRLIDYYEARDKVFIIKNKDLSSAEIAELYQSSHVTVHPTKAESFGKVPLESIACGTPVIAPIHSGLLDFLTLSNTIVVDVACVQPSFQRFGRMTDAGYIVDEADLRRCLRLAYENWQDEKQRVISAQKKLRESYQWPTLLRALSTIIPAQQT